MTYARLFRSLDLGPSTRHGALRAASVRQDDEAATIRMEVPGYAPEAVEITTQGRVLTVTGKAEGEAADAADAFSRSFEFPVDLDLAKAEATVRHGLLTIRVPRREEAKPQTIVVKAA